jgi:hypothetical protein
MSDDCDCGYCGRCAEEHWRQVELEERSDYREDEDED